jgi:hypothetical protein
VRFILREFPLDPLATAGFMLARCDGEQKFYPIADMLFQQQAAWAFKDKPLDALRQMMRQAGFSQEKFDTCLRDQKLYDAVNAVKNRGVETFKVQSTPTFFINGQRYPGNMSINEFEKILTPSCTELNPLSREGSGGRSDPVMKLRACASSASRPSSSRRLPDRAGLTGVVGRTAAASRTSSRPCRWVHGRELAQEHAAPAMDDVIFAAPAAARRATHG